MPPQDQATKTEESPYPAYQNGECVSLLASPTNNTSTSPKYRHVLLFAMGLLLGSIVMMYFHHFNSATSNNNNIASIKASASSTNAETTTTAVSSSSAYYQPNDLDASTSSSTTITDLNTESASHNIPSGCEATVVILRHCEKFGPTVADKDNNQHCSYVGHQRAHYLPTLFGSNDKNLWPPPSQLYALTEGRGGHVNYREVETIQPLASKFGLDILKHASNKDLARDLLQQLSQGTLCGRVVAVSWEHSIVGDLAERLGCTDCPKQGYPDDSFDQVWMLRYVYDVLGTPVYQDKHPVEEDGDAKDKSENSKTKHGKLRYLKATESSKKKDSQVPEWSIFSTITAQHFDPLKFSNYVGDYDGSGKPGGEWLKYNSPNGGVSLSTANTTVVSP